MKASAMSGYDMPVGFLPLTGWVADASNLIHGDFHIKQ